MKLPSSASSLPSSATSAPFSTKSYQICELAATFHHHSFTSSTKQSAFKFPISAPTSTSSHKPSHSTLPPNATNPRGFGKPLKKPRKSKKPNTPTYNQDSNDDDEQEEEQSSRRDVGVIPEVVTNRMISRIGFSVGIPLFVGLLFFPFFYYLKVGLKIDVPNWVPFIVSFVFFGTALLGVSYGIVSSSWDPLREGSVLGWNEARRNWPVFWGSIWGGRAGKD